MKLPALSPVRAISAAILCSALAAAVPAPEITTVTIYQVSVSPPPGLTLEPTSTIVPDEYKYLGTDEGGSTTYQLAHNAAHAVLDYVDESTTRWVVTTVDTTETYVRDATAWRGIDADAEMTFVFERCEHTAGGHGTCVYWNQFTLTGWSVPAATLEVDTESGDTRVLEGEENRARVLGMSLGGVFGVALLAGAGLMWI